MSDMDSGDWREYKMLILDGLRTMNTDLKEISGEVREFKTSINDRLLDMSTQLVAIKSEVKTSARNWALLAGIIPALLILAIWKLFSS